MQSDAWGPAGQMETATSDIFGNLQWGQCDWLLRVHKGTKGTMRHSIMLLLVFAFLSNGLNIQYSIAISWRNNITLIDLALRGKRHLNLNGEL